MQELQRTLAGLMPFAKVCTSENVLDGTAQAEIVVPTAADEWSRAQQIVKKRTFHAALRACGVGLALVGLGMALAEAGAAS